MNSRTDASQMSIDGMPGSEPASAVPPHMLARVNALAIKIVHPFMAQNDIRYYLNGVNIRPLEDDTVMIVATDGHRYVIVRDQSGYAEREMVVAVHKDGLKHAVKESTFDVLSNGAAIFNDKGGMPTFMQPGNALIDGKFPRIENIASVFGYREGISGAVNPAYLNDALKIGQHFGDIRFFTRDGDSPLMFVVGGLGDLEVFGGIMKVRDSFEQLPSWFPAPSPFELSPE